MIKQDFLERQIEAIAKTFAAVLFGKDRVKKAMENYEQEQDSTGLEEEMYKRLIKKYIAEKKYKEAEEIIFELVKANNSAVNLEVAISFYNELHDLDEESLVKAGFSEEKIKEGISRLIKFYE